jgi:hypothetical protein
MDLKKCLVTDFLVSQLSESYINMGGQDSASWQNVRESN